MHTTRFVNNIHWLHWKSANLKIAGRK